MNRRHFMAGIVSAGSAAGVALMASQGPLPAQRRLAGGGVVNVVDTFGFVPDGRTDNYAAFHRWAAHVNKVRGGSYLFPPGTYFVRQHRTKSLALRDPREVINSLIVDCDGLDIDGSGARIRLNGAFHRSARPRARGEQAGRHMALFMPFELHRCRNITIRGFEMDGGVRQMSRDAAVTEIYAALIALNGCTDVLLEDLDLHHCQTDAVYLGNSVLGGVRPGLACRNVTLRNVRCHNNARGGMGVIQVYGLLCTDCSFNDNGETGGKYLPHAPRFGVTVEPDYVSAADVDIRTGNLEFRRCQFSGNGTAFGAAYGDRCRGYLRLIDCRSSNPTGDKYHMIVNWVGGLIEGGVHDAGEGVIWASWHGQKGGDLTIRDCEIRTSGLYGLYHPFADNIVQIEGIRLVGTHRKADPTGLVMAIQGDPGDGRKNLVRGCEVFVPAARKSPAAAYDYEVSFYHTISEDNSFRTNLPSAGGQHFCTQYGPGAVARSDRYRGTAPGTQDSFRPVHMSTHDSRMPYSKARADGV